jgi:DNA-binding SARP family transcriptional activator/predicted ATPase
VIAAEPWLHRVTALVEALDAPLVVVWGPPGTGKRALLAGLLERGAAAWTATSLSIQRQTLVAAEPVEQLDTLRGVGPAVTVVTVSDRRPTEADLALIGPTVLALRPEELRHTFADEAVAVWRATHGWHRLVRLIAADPTISRDPEHPALESFVRDQVLPWLGDDLAGLAAELALADGWVRDEVGRYEPLVADLGLVLRTRRGVALPPVLVPPLRRLAEQRFGAAGCRARARRLELWQKGTAAARPLARLEPPPRHCRFMLQLLGEPSLRRFDRSDQRWKDVAIGAPSAWLILARLALERQRRVQLTELEDAITEGEEQRTPALHPILSRIRSRLGEPDAILRDGAGYRLGPSPEDWWIDYEALESNARAVEPHEHPEAAEDRLEAARLLGAGVVLAGIERRWLRRPRLLAREHRTEALLRLAELRRHLGDSHRALDVYRELIEEDPTNEGAVVGCMQLMAGRGRRDAVHRLYADLCTVFEDELGVLPSPETTAEYHRLLGR